jgi:hypothetical protein
MKIMNPTTLTAIVAVTVAAIAGVVRYGPPPRAWC